MRHADVRARRTSRPSTSAGSVLNGGDGWHAHPTQALLDLFTMRRAAAGGSIAGRKVVILGDVLHSRVARSNIWSLTAAGADLWLCGPATLLRGFEAWAAVVARGGPRALHGHLRPRRGAPRRRRRDGPPDPARADGGRAPAVAARVRGALRAHARAAGARRPRCAGHAPGPDERGRRDRGRRRGRATVGDHRPGRERRRGADGDPLPARRPAGRARDGDRSPRQLPASSSRASRSAGPGSSIRPRAARARARSSSATASSRP